VIRWLSLVATVLLVVAALALTLQSLQHEERAAENPPARKPRYELTSAEWTRYDAQGQAFMHATADTIRYYDDKSAELETLNVDHLGGEPGPWHLSAPRGFAPANEERMELTAPVTLHGALRDGEPMQLTVDQLWVDYARRELYTDAPVDLIGPYREMHAQGMNADWAGTRLKLMHDVRVKYALRR
jgi:LPS export ABC transporter protein LptC